MDSESDFETLSLRYDPSCFCGCAAKIAQILGHFGPFPGVSRTYCGVRPPRGSLTRSSRTHYFGGDFRGQFVFGTKDEANDDPPPSPGDVLTAHRASVPAALGLCGWVYNALGEPLPSPKRALTGPPTWNALPEAPEVTWTQQNRGTSKWLFWNQHAKPPPPPPPPPPCVTWAHAPRHFSSAPAVPAPRAHTHYTTWDLFLGALLRVSRGIIPSLGEIPSAGVPARRGGVCGRRRTVIDGRRLVVHGQRNGRFWGRRDAQRITSGQ